MIKLNLVDLNKYVALHPLLNSCEYMGVTKFDGIIYRINERPFSFVPAFFNYKAEVRRFDNEVVYLLTEIPFTSVKMEYLFCPESTKIKIDFKLEIRGIFPFNRILRYKIMKAQDEIMRNI